MIAGRRFEKDDTPESVLNFIGVKWSYMRLIDEDFFAQTSQLDHLIEQSGSPLAVYFESGDCDDCRIWHNQILTDPPTRRLVAKMQNLQFDIRSEEEIILPNGQ